METTTRAMPGSPTSGVPSGIGPSAVSTQPAGSPCPSAGTHTSLHNRPAIAPAPGPSETRGEGATGDVVVWEVSGAGMLQAPTATASRDPQQTGCISPWSAHTYLASCELAPNHSKSLGFPLPPPNNSRPRPGISLAPDNSRLVERCWHSGPVNLGTRSRTGVLATTLGVVQARRQSPPPISRCG